MKYENTPLPNEIILWAELPLGYQCLVVISEGHAGVAVRSPAEDFVWDRKKALKIARGRCRKAQRLYRSVYCPHISCIDAALDELCFELDKILIYEKISEKELHCLNVDLYFWQGSNCKTRDAVNRSLIEGAEDEEIGGTDDMEEF